MPTDHSCNAYCRPDEGIHCDIVSTWSSNPTRWTTTPDDWRAEIARDFGELVEWRIATEAERPQHPAVDPASGEQHLTGSWLIWYRA